MYRVSKNLLMAKLGHWEGAYNFNPKTQSPCDYATWIPEPIWDTALPIPDPSDIFGKLGYTSPEQRSVFRHFAFHASRMAF